MRYLIGPVTAEFVQSYLSPNHSIDEFVPFGPGTALGALSSATWDEVAAQVGPIDAVLAWTAYTSQPQWLWSCPRPIIALAADANVLWSQYRWQLRQFDAILTDTLSSQTAQRHGLDGVYTANLFGLANDYLYTKTEQPKPLADRHIDILFVGNSHAAIHQDRNAWLGRVAQLRDQYHVIIRDHIYGDTYRQLLQQAKLVFNFSVRREANLRAFEVPASGAVLLQERANLELSQYLTPEQDYLTYDHQDFERVVSSILADPTRWQTIAQSGFQKVKQLTFTQLLSQALGKLFDPNQANALHIRSQQRLTNPKPPNRLVQTHEITSANEYERTPTELLDSLTKSQDWYLLALLDQKNRPRWLPRAANQHLLGRIAWADSFTPTDPNRAIAEYRLALQELTERPLPDQLLSLPTPWGLFDRLRVEWERIGYTATSIDQERLEKQRLLVWALHTRIANLSDDPVHWHNAARVRPDIFDTRGLLAESLSQRGFHYEAIVEYQSALTNAPLDLRLHEGLIKSLQGANRPIRTIRRAEHTFTNVVACTDPNSAHLTLDHPVGDELLSVIIPVWNQWHLTELCLQSLLKHTHNRLEVIVIDNGSTDDTPQYLGDWAKRFPFIKVITNETNRGYGPAINQGLQAATGAWLALLNNDVVVTPYWFERMVEPMLIDWPKVAAVGPVTNQAPDPQRVEPQYTDLNDLDAFAEDYWRRNTRTMMSFPRVTGFCLLTHRTPLAKIGLLDERFEVGFFEDDDLCFRWRQAGYDLRIALGVYLHHFGNQTFKALGIDTSAQLAQNWEKYRAKWGHAEAAKYHFDDGRPVASTTAPTRTVITTTPSSLAPTKPRRVSVALNMIVKNEERHITDCLRGMSQLFDEIIVIDTGSTDRTAELAEAQGAKVFHWAWQDHFAKARNVAIENTTADYIFWLDADDRLDPDNYAKLNQILSSLTPEPQAFVMKCRCLSDFQGGPATVVDHLRLFPRLPGVRWEHRVHEQILPALRRAGAKVDWAEVTVTHLGYAYGEMKAGKLDRDRRLLERELDEMPNHPFTLFNLGSIYTELGDFPRAIQTLKASLAASHPSDSIVRKLYALIAQGERATGKTNQAYHTIQAGRGHYPKDIELLYLEGQIYGELKRWDLAEQSFRQIFQAEEGAHFASVDDTLRGPKALHHLAWSIMEQGRFPEAEQLWQSISRQHPQFEPARQGLLECGRRKSLAQ